MEQQARRHDRRLGRTVSGSSCRCMGEGDQIVCGYNRVIEASFAEGESANILLARIILLASGDVNFPTSSSHGWPPRASGSRRDANVSRTTR